MPPYERVVIVGVGLLGGSIGLALRSRDLARVIVGVSRRTQTIEQAKSLGAIHEAAPNIDAACSAGADVTIICTPVQQIPQFALECQAAMDGSGLITDVGSTKYNLCRQLEITAPLFCGAHPLAGSDKSGVQHAKADLFQQQVCVVTPSENTPENLAARTETFWQNVGCRTLRMSPERHDAALAVTSHLPHVVAAMLAASTPEELLPLAASGWRDTTRVAAGNAEMWAQILVENRPSVLEALRHFGGTLTQWIEALEAADQARLSDLLTAGKQKRDALGS